jgi:putative phosphoesterase
MKVGVISDTHGNVDAVRRAVKRLKENGARFILHLGDGVEDAIRVEKEEGVPVQYVAGNCDNNPGMASEHYFSWKGMGVLALHGHRHDLNRYHVQEKRKQSLDKLAAKAAVMDAGIVLYGHTHRADDFVHAGVRFINPGALDFGTADKSCCLIEIDREDVKVEYFRIR